MGLNKSASRTIDIIELLSKAPRALTLSEICRELAIPKSSAFEILDTLLQKQVVEYDNEQLKSFRLGIKLFSIGYRVMTQTDLYRASHGTLVQLVKQTGETAYLAVEKNGWITYLDKVENNQPIRATCEIGSSNYLHLTGLGKALLAAYPEYRIQKLMGSGPLKTITPQSIGTYKQLLEELEKTRSRGYAIDDRESMEYVKCIAAPIRDHMGKAIAAISTSVLFSQMTDERMRELSPYVTGAALEISHKLGYSGGTLY